MKRFDQRVRYQCQRCKRYFRLTKKRRFRQHYLMPDVICPGGNDKPDLRYGYLGDMVDLLPDGN